MAACIAVFSSLTLIRGGDFWLGTLYLLILLIPISGGLYVWLKKSGAAAKMSSVEWWGGMLFALQGAALACWAYDLATTFYAIDVVRLAVEVNPLGWPLGALGAFAYYAPTVLLSYVLLFRIKQKTSLYAAVPMTLVMLCMATMNLDAGVQNFRFFTETATLAAGVRYNLLALVAAADVVYACVFVKFAWIPLFKGQAKLKTVPS